MSVIVKLSSAELMMLSQIGCARQIMALQQGYADKHGFEGDPWGVHIEGACGEYAFCKSANITWVPMVGTFKRSADVGHSWEVKTRSRDDYELLIRPDDNVNRQFILVTGRAPNYTVHGWMNGQAARRDEWWQTHGDRPGAWFVPQASLLNIAELVG